MLEVTTLFISSDKIVSKTPKGRATDTGSLIHIGTLPLKNLMLLDFAPTYFNREFCQYHMYQYVDSH